MASLYRTKTHFQEEIKTVKQTGLTVD